MGNASVKGGHNSKYFIQNNSGANRRIRNMTNYTWAGKCLFSAFTSKNVSSVDFVLNSFSS